MRRIALVGFGSIAENGHLPALQSFADVEVTAVADVAPERLSAAHSLLPEAALFDSPEELIARADVEVVDICTPPSTHAELILASCRRGIPTIVCEKPLVLSVLEYQRIVRARDESGARLISVNNWLHSDLFRLVDRALQEGCIGCVRSVRLRTERPSAARGHAGWVPKWRTDLAYSGGGIMLDHGWHQLYLLLGWIRQPLESVSARTRTADPRNHPVEDEAVVTLTFSSARGRIELFWTAPGRSNDGLIEGADGNIIIFDDRIVVHNSAVVRELSFKGKLTQSSYHPDWFREVFRYNVLDTDRREADRNFAEAGVLVSVMSAAYRSARDGGEEIRPELSGVPGAEAENVGGRGTSITSK